MVTINQDIEIVESILRGNTKLFEIIIKRYELSVQRFIYNMLRSKEAAEDVAQDVFISAYNKLYSFNNEYKFSTWLFSIAKNKTIDYVRKNKKVVEIEYCNEVTFSTSNSPENFVEFMETKKNVLEFIKSLNETDKQILLLRYTQEKTTFQQIALSLNMPESTIKKRYYSLYNKYVSFITVKLKKPITEEVLSKGVMEK
ncbi:MAG: sigma-70 family RNA polymerase sigma factor [Clostridiaceae bacterium]|nr:sigma-70 family RNA polymerase sigma factor [Clostridiaceae bacterium]